MHKTEKDNTAVANEKYSELVCTKDQVEESITSELSNDNLQSNEIIGYIYLPKVDEKSAILQGDMSDDQVAAMDRGVSHDPRSFLPGDSGNTVIAGHRELFFKHFLDLEVGDSVILNIKDNIYIYQIDSFEVINPEDADKVFYDNDEDTLVMYTCYPIEAWKPFNQRIVLKAHRIKSTTVETCE